MTVILDFLQSCQAQQGYQNIDGCRFKSKNEGVQYLNFYGNLIKLVDSYLVELMDTLDDLGLTQRTVVIRTADHGEMGGSHGGMVEKQFNMYEETIRVSQSASSLE